MARMASSRGMLRSLHATSSSKSGSQGPRTTMPRNAGRGGPPQLPSGIARHGGTRTLAARLRGARRSRAARVRVPPCRAMPEGSCGGPPLPALRGMVVRGPWLPDFEELVAWSDRNIPRDDAILAMPGEDLFYFATGRRPHFPVLMFDRTVNPYAPRELAALAAARDVRWVIVKKRLQVNGDPMPELPAVLALLQPRFHVVAELRN